MRLQLRKRTTLVLAVAATQAICLCGGVVLFGAWLEAAVRTTVQQQVLGDNIQTARQMGRLIREMNLNDPRFDVDSWERLQDTVRQISLPNEGFICVTDASDGRVLCHPKLREKPAYGPSDRRASERVTVDPSQPVEIGDAGVFDTMAGIQVIAVGLLPELHAKVMVHQLGAGIDKAVARVLGPVVSVGIGVSIALVLATTCAVFAVVRRYENQLAAVNENLESLVTERTRALTKTRNAVIFGLAKLAESRDSDTGEHLDRIRSYVGFLARRLKKEYPSIDEAYVENLSLASSLHDIGKVSVPDAVLLKPGRLEPDERRQIETHAIVGGDCLKAIGERLGEDDFLQLAKEIAYCHHERWDGDGYPFQIAGDSIPLAARIVAVADVYDALRSRRPYKDAKTHDEARAILLDGAGSHFDPVVIDAFLAAEGEFRAESPDLIAVAEPTEAYELSGV